MKLIGLTHFLTVIGTLAGFLDHRYVLAPRSIVSLRVAWT